MLAENWLDVCRDENGQPFRLIVEKAEAKRFNCDQYLAKVTRDCIDAYMRSVFDGDYGKDFREP